MNFSINSVISPRWSTHSFRSRRFFSDEALDIVCGLSAGLHTRKKGADSAMRYRPKVTGAFRTFAGASRASREERCSICGSRRTKSIRGDRLRLDAISLKDRDLHVLYTVDAKCSFPLSGADYSTNACWPNGQCLLNKMIPNREEVREINLKKS
jgi:hypothetical protein